MVSRAAGRGRNNPRRGIKVTVSQDRMGNVTVTPSSARVRKVVERHLARFGERDASVFLQEWRGDEFLDGLPARTQETVRAGYDVEMIMDPYAYGMLRGWDVSELPLQAETKRAAKGGPSVAKKKAKKNPGAKYHFTQGHMAAFAAAERLQKAMDAGSSRDTYREARAALLAAHGGLEHAKEGGRNLDKPRVIQELKRIRREATALMDRAAGYR